MMRSPVKERGPTRSRFAITGLATILVAACATMMQQSPAAAALDELGLFSGSVKPAVVSDPDSARVNVGLEFSTDTPGTVTGVQFYRSGKNHGPQQVQLWGSGSTPLASTQYSGTRTGWVTVALPRPIRVEAKQRYTASYVAPKGRYSSQNYAFSESKPLVRAPLTGHRGVYTYGSAKPTSTYRNSQYYVDVAFVPSAPTSSTPAPAAPAPTTSPTPSPQPTTSPELTASDLESMRLNVRDCAKDPSACGYADADNTGPAIEPRIEVPSQVRSGLGWRWEDYLGAVRVTGADAVLTGLDIAGGVVIDAPRVTLSNSRITACGGAWDSDVVAVRSRESADGYNGDGARILNNEINGSPANCSNRARSGIRDIYGEAQGMYVSGNDISGTGNGITVEYEALVENNWVHDLGHRTADHHSGLSTHGGAKSVIFRKNTVLLHSFPEYNDGGGVSAAITVYSDFARAQNVMITNNLVSGGAYTIFGGNSGAAYKEPAQNISITGNRLLCGGWVYGPVAHFSIAGTGNVLSNNYCDQSSQVVAD